MIASALSHWTLKMHELFVPLGNGVRDMSMEYTLLIRAVGIPLEKKLISACSFVMPLFFALKLGDVTIEC